MRSSLAEHFLGAVLAAVLVILIFCSPSPLDVCAVTAGPIPLHIPAARIPLDRIAGTVAPALMRHA